MSMSMSLSLSLSLSRKNSRAEYVLCRLSANKAETPESKDMNKSSC